MKKTVMILVVLLFSIRSYAPFDMMNRMEAIAERMLEEENDMELFNLLELEDGSKKTRKKVFNLVQPIIELYLERGEYKYNFPYMQDSISHALACIFVSESSNRKGHSARSSLWLTHKNPFGLTGRNGVTKMSWEMIKGKRVDMNVTFRTFNSLNEAVESLLWDYLFKTQFFKVRQSTSVKEFLNNLYSCGYMTNHGWPRFAYNEIYLKSIE